MKVWFFSLFLFLNLAFSSSEAMQLIERLRKASAGDYIVTAIDNTYTTLIIKDKSDTQMSIEEITVPSQRLQNKETFAGWKKWAETGASGNTSWVLYTINISTGALTDYFSYTKKARANPANVDHFLSKLLTLELARLPKKDTKRIGPPPAKGKDSRQAWSPQMIYEGKVISGVNFEAWRTMWPQDTNELSGKIITVYVPKENNKYPSYFPYWLEIQGMVGKAKIRIIDSGRGLKTKSTSN